MKFFRVGCGLVASMVMTWGCGTADQDDGTRSQDSLAEIESNLGEGSNADDKLQSLGGGNRIPPDLQATNGNGTKNDNSIANGNDNGDDSGNDNGNGNDNGEDNSNDNGSGGASSNDNNTGNRNSNDNGNGNDNGGGEICPDGSLRLRADDLQALGGAEGELRYRRLPGGCERFRVKLTDFPLGVYDVSINDVVVVQVVTDSDGGADVEFDTEDGTFPIDFPDVFVGDVGDIGGLVGGVLLLDCSTTPDLCGNGNSNSNDNGAGNSNDNGG